MGWKIKGNIPLEITKCVIIVVPHTSWHDFYIGLFTRGILDIPIHFVGKKELFVFPFGYYFRWMGGSPLNRSKNQNAVDEIVSIFNKNKIFRLAISPEGTRKKVLKWRTGFYYIAKQANVPIIPVGFDYQKKEVQIHSPFFPSTNKESDFIFLESLFTNTIGRIAKNSYTP